MNYLRNRKNKENDNKEGSDPQTNANKGKNNKTKTSWGCKYLVDEHIRTKCKYSILMGLFIVFLIFIGFFQKCLEFYHTHFYKFKYIDVSDTEKLKEVFFSNKPYLVYCKNDKKEVIHPVINNSISSFPSILNVAITNCKSLLPSKQNVYQRFNLSDNTKAFIVCYGRKPKPITDAILNNRKKFIAFVHESLVFGVPFFSKFPQFQTKCLNKNKKCVLFISSVNLTTKSVKYNYINDIFVNNKYFGINSLIVDNRKFLVKLSDEVFNSYSKKKDIHVLCLFNNSTDDTNEYYGYFYKDEFDNFKKISSFISGCIKATPTSRETIKLSSTPQIKYRTSKKK
ncbi:conserved Plasmodium protein, unknown function [Plasmodium berghei]|uniref:Uncharacterized protein n=2 Tax=Plasmodium berghei TaxID=5821 RepID=A0A509APM0_PLABA|nr:conserved protein, unknown function [Plasmodium berghei ANKA]CXI93696.1 conserved Plasmodium protein, unknown function [Plasmodium berghei]SCL96875.1 conserved Plasmodium protein, unknown function [Plasmodium berghei]SCM16505.1 conserved Plasmodium protein, unknown function [Plasmodium berghei]SCM18299.1 conserved Plasmodium protein, unknown function [Plasmodium berghei]SCN27728.1 conserved Plasmodium protein, unknown function [Plasmodium berghei]|eukprot:XP_034423382.1 conserved protein, unknown function [Plasmodium berghei ANKA]